MSSDPFEELTDPPMFPYYGTTQNYNGTGTIKSGIYHRRFRTTGDLTMTVNKNYVTLGINRGSGTVSDLNGVTGSVNIVGSDEVSIVNGVDSITVDINTSETAISNTIPKRDSGGNFEVSAPISGLQVANKDYVDNIAAGLTVHAPVRVVDATSLGTDGVDYQSAGTGIGKTLTQLTGPSQLTLDSVALVNGDRVLITADGVHNGIYTVTNQGSATPLDFWVLTRATDADEDLELMQGTYVYVSEGTNYGYTGWVVSSPNPLIVDTDIPIIVQFNAAGQLTGSNVGTLGSGIFKQKTGNNLEFYNIAAGSNKITVSLSGNNVLIDAVESQLNLNDMMGPLLPIKGGTGLTTYASNCFLVSNGLAPFVNTKVVPTGTVVGTTDVQTLTNKVLTSLTNTIAASHIMTNATNITINLTPPPGAGYSLISTSSTAASWQSAFPLVGETTSSQCYYGVGANVPITTYGTAFGINANTTGNFSVALGYGSSATGQEAIAIGKNSTSSHLRSIVLGNTTSDSNNQFKLPSNIQSFRALGISSVGSGSVVCRTSSGDIGPNTTGSVNIPVLSVDPTPVSGGMYFSSASSKMRISNGVTWTDVSMNAKTSITSLTNLSSPYTVRSFADTTCDAVSWKYLLKSTAGDLRSGEILAVWNATSNTITYDEVSTSDINDTTDVSFTVDISTNNVRFRMNITGVKSWSVTYYETQL